MSDPPATAAVPTSAAMHVACASDDRFAPFCATMLHSLFAHAADVPVIVHYLCPPEFSAAAQERLRGFVASLGGSLHFHVMADERVAGLPPMRGIQRIVWYRVFLPELLPGIERVLYLDADTLVVAPIAPLWRLDLGGLPLAAVPNPIEPAQRATQQAALGLPPSAVYFNSGVMLMDLAALRAADATARVLAYGREAAARLVWGDQDALNAVLATNYHQLHPRWNCQASLFSWAAARRMFGDAVVDDAVTRPSILHFGGSDAGRPWHYLCEHPERHRYQQHLRQTPWRDLPLQGRSLKNVVRRQRQRLGQTLRRLRDALRPAAH